MAINIPEIAQLFGFDEQTADVYIELLALKQLSTDEIQSFLDISQKDLVPVLKTLDDLGLIRKTSDGKSYEPVPLEDLEDTDLIENIKRVLFELKESESIGIVKYEGWDGIRKVYLEVLEEAIRTGEDIYAFEANIDKSDIGKDFLSHYIDRRKSFGITALVITPGDEADFEYKKIHGGELTQIMLTKGLEIDASVNIVGDLVMTFSVDDPRGTLQRERASANTWRAVFQQIWKNSNLD